MSGQLAAMAQQTVLITGGSGYLGQFLVEEFAKTSKVSPAYAKSIGVKLVKLVGASQSSL